MKFKLELIPKIIFGLAALIILIPFGIMGIIEILFFVSFGKINFMDFIGYILFLGTYPLIFTCLSWALILCVIGFILGFIIDGVSNE